MRLELNTFTEENLLNILRRTGYQIKSYCGGKGLCGSCKVKINKGNFKTRYNQFISEKEKNEGIVLACLSDFLGTIEIEIPEVSLLTEIYSKKDVFDVQEIEAKFDRFGYDFSPLAFKFFLELPKPTIDDALPDTARIIRHLQKKDGADVELDFDILREIPRVIRNSNFEVTAIIQQHPKLNKILYLEPFNTTNQQYGLAIDIGTTTVVVYLIDISNCKIISAKVSYNKQIQYGEDVITRIIYAEEKNENFLKLTDAVRDTVNSIVSKIVEEKKIDIKDIICVAIAGNPTMMHLFLHIPPFYLRKEPYIPTFKHLPLMKCQDVGLNLNPKAVVMCFPCVGSYIGGDAVSGVLACGIHKSNNLEALLDLGTNGQIVIGNKEFLISAACSIGPAFEGVGIKYGSKAVNGAIEEIKIENSEVIYKTIGNLKPLGICGSGLIDVCSELFKNGYIDRLGKFVEGASKRIIEKEEIEFLICSKEETSIYEDITITQSDIDNIVRSKGAVFHGFHILLKKLGLCFDDIKKIYISGGFGSTLNIENAIKIGLLPDVDRQKFSIVGNSSILGATMALLSKRAREELYLIAEMMTYVDLSSIPEYLNTYTASLFLPHTDLSLFPSVIT